MARAHAETTCWGPGAPLTIAPADGDMVARALNTAFDNWLPPFDQALAADVPVGATGLTRAQFYEPDQLATTTYESADRHGPDPETQPVQDGIPDYDAPAGPYDTVPLPGFGPLEPVHGPGIGYDPCHDGTTARYGGGAAGPACTLDFVGDYHEGGSAGAGAVRSRLEHYWSTMYGLDPATLPGDVTTWYELYRVEKDLFAALDTDPTNSRILEYSAANAARYGLESTTEQYVKHGPDEYATATGSDALLNPGYERRRLRSAMVNCAGSRGPRRLRQLQGRSRRPEDSGRLPAGPARHILRPGHHRLPAGGGGRDAAVRRAGRRRHRALGPQPLRRPPRPLSRASDRARSARRLTPPCQPGRSRPCRRRRSSRRGSLPGTAGDIPRRNRTPGPPRSRS